MTQPKIAIVCDWLTSWGGAERVILALHHLYPDAPIYTSIYDPGNLPMFASADVRPSFLQKFPGAKRHHQWYLAQMPTAFESFDLSEYDIVISSAHSCAKGVITKPETLHVSYCHSPPRYLWDDSHRYVANYPWPDFLKRTLIPRFLHGLRVWDRAAADRVDHYVANSNYIADRIGKYYRREADVIYPPVDMDPYESVDKQDYYLAVGRLIPYKRFDLIVEAFNRLKWPLKIIGVGNQLDKLKKMADSNIEFLGKVPEDVLRDTYRHAKGFVFPQVEDFGITAIEAMAYGCPVVAYRKGGALETVADKVSGLFFDAQTPESLVDALQRCEKTHFDVEKIRAQAEKFHLKVFAEQFDQLVKSRWEEWQA
jgi:glycosyltransferase involved in cell wall biosynthesis